MEAIRKALGKPIVRVDTADFEQMESVRPCSRSLSLSGLALPFVRRADACLSRLAAQTLKAALKG